MDLKHDLTCHIAKNIDLSGYLEDQILNNRDEIENKLKTEFEKENYLIMKKLIS